MSKNGIPGQNTVSMVSTCFPGLVCRALRWLRFLYRQLAQYPPVYRLMFFFHDMLRTRFQNCVVRQKKRYLTALFVAAWRAPFPYTVRWRKTRWYTVLRLFSRGSVDTCKFVLIVFHRKKNCTRYSISQLVAAWRVDFVSYTVNWQNIRRYTVLMFFSRRIADNINCGPVSRDTLAM